MNKYIVLMLVFAVIVLLTGCSEYQSSAGKQTPAATSGKTSGKSVSHSGDNGHSAPAGRRMLAEDFSSGMRTGTAVVYFAKVSCPACKHQDKIWQRAVRKLPAGVKSDKRFTYGVNYRAYGVTQLPTLIFYKNGVEVSRSIGVTNENKIISSARGAM